MNHKLSHTSFLTAVTAFLVLQSMYSGRLVLLGSVTGGRGDRGGGKGEDGGAGELGGSGGGISKCEVK